MNARHPGLDLAKILSYRWLMPVLRLLVASAVLSGLLVACGVRGDPEPPPGSDPNKNKDRPIVLDKLI